MSTADFLLRLICVAIAVAGTSQFILKAAADAIDDVIRSRRRDRE